MVFSIIVFNHYKKFEQVSSRNELNGLCFVNDRVFVTLMCTKLLTRTAREMSHTNPCVTALKSTFRFF